MRIGRCRCRSVESSWLKGGQRMVSSLSLVRIGQNRDTPCLEGKEGKDGRVRSCLVPGVLGARDCTSITTLCTPALACLSGIEADDSTRLPTECPTHILIIFALHLHLLTQRLLFLFFLLDLILSYHLHIIICRFVTVVSIRGRRSRPRGGYH